MHSLLRISLLSSAILFSGAASSQSKKVASASLKQTTTSDSIKKTKASSEAMAATVRPDNLLDVAVSDNSTTYIVFGGPVSLVDVGQASNYLVKIEANAVFIRAKHKNAAATPILIRYGSKYWMGQLVYVSSPVLQLYDFQNGLPNTHNSSSGETSTLAMDRSDEQKAVVNANLDKLSMEKEELQAVATVDNDLVLSLSNIRNDKNFTYLRFKVINKSNIDYDVDYTDFQLVENSKKRFLGKKKNEARRPLASTGDETKKIIAGRSTGYLTYAIPLYAATDRGYLEVTLRELNGARVLVLPIPSKIVNRASTI